MEKYLTIIGLIFIIIGSALVVGSISLFGLVLAIVGMVMLLACADGEDIRDEEA